MKAAIKCPVDGDCFAKRHHEGMCMILIEPAVHKNECPFRKEFQAKPKEWKPETKEEREWARVTREKVLPLRY